MTVMHGASAQFILVLFLFVATLFFTAIYFLWKDAAQRKVSKPKALGISVFVAVWFVLIAGGYVEKARFHRELHRLSADSIQSVQIGKHEFRDRAAVEEIVAALKLSRWFEINHGGWGDTIPLLLKGRSGETTTILVAKYFRETGAVVARSDSRSEANLKTIEFAPELPRVLEKYGVLLPDCDTRHGRPCSAEQLNP